jgi:hypothetical protein
MPRPEAASVLWSPPVELSKVETMICRRLQRTGRLFAFLRRHRLDLFDEAFQRELASMYADAPRGTPPKPPALLAMVTLLQAYEKKSDAAAVEEVVFDRRWQMVLGCLGVEEPPFSQGVLVDFRRRLIAHDMDRRLLERTVELARRTKDFGDKALKVALDSSPLWGAGRVEDTFNLLGHALELVVECAATILALDPAAVRAEAKLEVLGGSSLKATLDIDWDDATEQQRALTRLFDEVQRLRRWVQERLAEHVEQPPLKEALALVARVIEQDLEPDPNGGGPRLRRGVAHDRRISVSDADMRHGRKSRSRVINGYKRHIARDLSSGLILAATVRPANEPEHQATETLRPEVEVFGDIAELHIDRGYLASAWTRELFQAGRRILAKPWSSKNADRFPKTAFTIELATGTVQCPERVVAPIKNALARFPAARCDGCGSRARCTSAALGRGRTISIHPDEALLIQLRALKTTSDGRARLRERVHVEHALAHISHRQGPRARYLGTRKNTLDLRRVCVVENLHRIDRLRAAA